MNQSLSSNERRPHVPIMLKEVLAAFEGVKLKYFYEGTLGAGGHARAILENHPEIMRYIGCDKDPKALELAQIELAPWKNKVELIHGNFADLDLHLMEREITAVDGFFLT